MTADRQPRWNAHPFISFAVRVVALILPLAASLAAALAVGRLLPTPHGFRQTVLWWIAFVGAALAVLAIVDRAARRLLPLAALLSLSLVFPHRIPNRFRVALRAGSTRELNRRIIDARERGLVDEPSRAAETILVLTAALAKHDRLTRGHSERVRALTDLLAVELHLADDDQDLLRWASLLHDVGKIEVDAELLNKPGAPEEKEWESIREHPEAGMSIAAPLAEWLGPWVDAIGEHHERYDGEGYPNRVAGEDISFAGRVVAVADAYETMTAGRPYKRPMSVRAARQELADKAGSHFDPAVVRAFLNLSIGRLWRLAGVGAWVGSLAILPRPLATLTESSKNAGAAATLAAAAVLGAGLASPGDADVLGARLRHPPVASPAPGGTAPPIVRSPIVPDEPSHPPGVLDPPRHSPRPSSSPRPSPKPSPRSSPSPSPTPSESPPPPEPTCLELLLTLVSEAPGSITIDRISEVVECITSSPLPAGVALFLR